ncbi:hypothetical protein V5799_005144 [Amblyomma americanum]|uniref:Transmembrane protein n=1 Tax=Amblyomma americanum TaxID=6943 RepID=A0AAQ4E034_AMBAM
MKRRVSWSDPLIETKELSPPILYEWPAAEPYEVPASPPVASPEQASPEAASPVSALPTEAGGQMQGGLNAAPAAASTSEMTSPSLLLSSSPAVPPSAATVLGSQDFAIYAASAATLFIFCVAVVAMMVFTSARAERKRATAAESNADTARVYYNPAWASIGNKTARTSEETTLNATTASSFTTKTRRSGEVASRVVPGKKTTRMLKRRSRAQRRTYRQRPARTQRTVLTSNRRWITTTVANQRDE